jgi:transposase
MTTTRQRVPRGGRTIREAAALTGLHPATIRRWTSEPRDVYLTQAEHRRDQIIALHRQGLGVRAIARQLTLSPGLVSTRLKEAREAGVDLSRIEPDADPGARDDG